MENELTDQELFYHIALSQVDNIGYVHARRLLQHFHSAEKVFHATAKELTAIEGLGQKRIGSLKEGINSKRVQKELAFIGKHGIQPLMWHTDAYPSRLTDCYDAPLILYAKGNKDLNPEKSVAVIGTRKNTEYGRKVTEDLIEGLKDLNITIVSGLAYGIDAIAHRKALQCGLPTFAVLAHGLDRIYPVAHRSLAKEVAGHGALVTEYTSGTNPDKQNFPMRNRIVAAMADITIVVETDIKGGAMITAKLAASYNHDVAAFPGRTTDTKSNGCNYLIKTNIAQLITRAEDVLEMMNWQRNIEKKIVQSKLFNNLSAEEMQLVNILQGRDAMHIDELMLKANMNSSVLASILLSLEFQNVVRSMPGKRYALR